MRKLSQGLLSVIASFLLFSGIGYSQASPSPRPSPTPAAVKQKASTLHTPESNFLKDIASDQKAIWTSPFHIGRSDLKWLVPFAGGTAALIATDEQTSAWVDRGGSLPGFSRIASFNGGVYVTFGVAGGMWGIGKWSHNPHLAETGRLATEALIDSSAVTEVAKFAFGRERPDFDNGEGRFFKGGRSFFSGHASSSWSVATVIACEYHDHPLAVWGAYGVATAVSLSRYTGRKHFLSDIFVGAGVGFGIGRYVCGKRARFAQDDDDDTTVSRRWTVVPYLDQRTAARGGSFVWRF
ncbi:MAG: phosphatase PAP2 family protein [Pyrinomonadaceae bacterium]